MASTGGAVQQLNYINEDAHDKYLTKDPKFNFIEQNYRQYNNYSIENINVFPSSPSNFGSIVKFKIKRLGDFLKKVYLNITLPPLQHTTGNYAGWCNGIGFNIIDYVEFRVNEVEINKMYGLFIAMYYELTQEKDEGKQELVGLYDNLASLKLNALEEREFTTELPLYFSENIQCAFPMLMLSKTNSIEIIVKLNDFDKCVVYDGNIAPVPVTISNCYLITDQIFINEIDRKKYIGTPHNIIIKQYQYTYDDIIGLSKKVPLLFNHSVNQLIFAIREKESENNNDWLNFSKRNGNVHQHIVSLMEKAELLVDNRSRNSFQSSHELSKVNSNKYYNHVTNMFLYTIPFSSNPTTWIPNGSLNFSVAHSIELNIKMRNGSPSSSIHVFAVNHNFLTIENGEIKLAFSE